MDSPHAPGDFTEPDPATSSSTDATPPQGLGMRILNASNTPENQLASDLPQRTSPELRNTIIAPDQNDVDDPYSFSHASETPNSIGRGQSRPAEHLTPSLADRSRFQRSQLTRDSSVMETNSNKSYVNPKPGKSMAQQLIDPAMAGDFGLGTEYQTNFARIPHPLGGNLYQSRNDLGTYLTTKRSFNPATESKFESSAVQQQHFVQRPTTRFNQSYDHNYGSTDVYPTSAVDLGLKGYHYISTKQKPKINPISVPPAENPSQRFYSGISFTQYPPYFKSPQVYRSVYDVGNKTSSTKAAAALDYASYAPSTPLTHPRVTISIPSNLAFEYSGSQQTARMRRPDSALTFRRQDSANRATQVLTNPKVALTVHGPMDLSRIDSNLITALNAYRRMLMGE